MSPKNTILINDFRAGELNPDMDARADLKAYYRGCRILENAMPIIEGGVARVPGTYYVRPVKQLEEGWNIRITKSGSGGGVVTSDLIPGIDCGSTCYTFFISGSTVVLTAVPIAGNTFVGWSGEGFSGVNPISVPMNGNKVINAEFSAAVHDYLIGWYKNDEGSGATVINYATDGSLGGGLLPNLIVEGNQDIFWQTDSGFGYSQAPILFDDPPICHAAKEFTSRPTNLLSYGIFYKRMEEMESGLLGIFIAVEGELETSLTIDFVEGVYEDNFDGGPILIDVPYVWNFFFIDDSWIPKRVNPDGTLSSFDGNVWHEEFNINRLSIGSDYGLDYFGGSGGSLGDCIIYNNKAIPISTLGDGYKPWSQWYDELRSRYGMAARSGW